MQDNNNTEQTDAIDVFWTTYQEQGLEPALNYIKGESNGNLELLHFAVPHLVDEAKSRDIDMIKFLEELDVWLKENPDDATRIADDADQLPADSSDDASQSEDETESTEAGASDRPADAGEEE